jgi:DNA-binding NtrC family response regulator
MALSALKLVGSERPSRETLPADSGAALDGIRKRSSQSVFAVQNEDLPRLRVLDAVVDRGRKNEAKGLARSLLGYARIPLIEGSYKNAGQFLRSIRAFLKRAAEDGEANLYIVGVDGTIFRELWAAAGRPEESGAPLSHPSRLQKLLPHRDVPKDLLEAYVGRAPEVQLVRQLILRAAELTDPVLILGDTGTGKEVVARAIHDNTRERAGSFVAVNCGAIPGELLESELFGHEPGAFTGANYRKVGLWKVADHGTLFLDEIGDLALHHQVKILRALQEGVIRPLASQHEVKVSARVIAATNRDIYAMVRAGDFREDLYYRLRSFLIRTPALRDHPEDISILARIFWRGITRHSDAELPEAILTELHRYRWPGNARELRAILTNLYALFGRRNLDLGHLKAVLELQAPAGASPRVDGQEADLAEAESERRLHRIEEAVRAFRQTIEPLSRARPFDAGEIASTRRSVRQRLLELELLCLHPALFESEVTAALDRLKVAFGSFDEVLQKEPNKARRFWRDQGRKEASRGLEEILRRAANTLKPTVAVRPF